MRHTFLLTLDYPPAVGGVSRYLADLTAGSKGGLAVLQNDLLPWWSRGFKTVFRAVRNRPDARLLAGQILPLGTVAAIVRRLRGVPFGVVTYGLDLLLPMQSFRKRLLARWILRSAEFVVSISPYTTSLVRTYGVPAARINEIPPGTRFPVHPASKEALDSFRQTHRLRTLTLLSVGRLVPRKGIDRAIEAVVRVRERFPDVRYLIVGEGPDRPRLEALVERLGVAETVEFLGAVSDEELAMAYDACDIFLLPTREVRDPAGRTVDVEGFGIVFMEAMAHEKPVIAGRSGAVPDTVQDGVVGLLVDPDDPNAIAQTIVDLGTNPARRAALGRAGRSWAYEAFNPAERDRRFRRVLGEPSTDLVSVIVPAYNAAQTVVRTIESILAQTHRAIEIIVVDDGSTDRTAELLKPFAGRVTVIRQSNRGAPVARNRGFERSRGRYVLFCDADVTLRTDCLEHMVLTLELHPEASYCYSSFRFGWHTFDLFDFDPERLRRENYISTMSLIRRDRFIGFREELTRYQDWDLWKRLLERGDLGIWYPERLFSAPLRGGISRDSLSDLLRLLGRKLRPSRNRER